ncbi:hypothetical protein phytr_10150 [Candidatus Phycorickettsia trachydisci]|uniref:Uncharacterized protein n=1 Tax=Candidatus Phycorickettsia trachydisci TaxID=2115978 RepID=A0A2P1P9J1_9RICK|nr:hypothetical protein [Candidatus Phycorickettsia trachydisci]AVP87943.1 hypothetical protein phytr_10150 [Candidatus Phycorickettsia trachydisci]
MKKSLSIFLSDNTFRINPSVATDQGASVAEDFVIFLDQGVTKEELAKNVLKAFIRPTTIIPHPKTREEWFAADKVWYKVMKIKSWKSFIKESKAVYANLDDNKVNIVPTRNIMPRGFIEEVLENSNIHLQLQLKFDPEMMVVSYLQNKSRWLLVFDKVCYEDFMYNDVDRFIKKLNNNGHIIINYECQNSSLYTSWLKVVFANTLRLYNY